MEEDFGGKWEGGGALEEFLVFPVFILVDFWDVVMIGLFRDSRSAELLLEPLILSFSGGIFFDCEGLFRSFLSLFSI